MDETWLLSFREKLEKHYAWPSLYVFKFIVPTGQQDQVKNLFPSHTAVEKLSKQGNYTSITIHMMMQSSDAVIEIYKRASLIDGIVAL
ncbi:MAG TPA: DUF493 family protein [Chryseolinea sp.]